MWLTSGVEGYLAECHRRSGDLNTARSLALAGLESADRSDSMYRDTFRGVCLCALGRTALEQNDRDAALVAFRQAVQHHRGRPRALGGGHLLVQSLAGLARAGEGDHAFEQAIELFERREGFSFHVLWCCTDDITLLELARAAAAVGRAQQAGDLLKRAQDDGSAEATEKATLDCSV
jgi:hypothetical protein